MRYFSRRSFYNNISYLLRTILAEDCKKVFNEKIFAEDCKKITRHNKSSIIRSMNLNATTSYSILSRVNSE